jgi:2-polyprenyl-3-methyl-5-hydroxy-6-metoxy-1,4-benzoquinol methylase
VWKRFGRYPLCLRSENKNDAATVLFREGQVMQNIFGAVSEKWKMRGTSARKKMWDREYASGFGELLKSPEAVEHNLTLVDFMTSAKKATTILDVCCGEGILLDCLERTSYQKYVGFDFSDIALKNASKRANAKSSFTRGIAETFVPDGHFESIVFNECLYCLAEPLRVLHRYEQYLEADGVMLVSLFTKTERVKLLAAEISTSFKVMRNASLTNGQGTWECFMLLSTADAAPPRSSRRRFFLPRSYGKNL